MTDLATLYIKVDSKGVVTASRELKKLTGKSKDAEKATKSVTKSFSNSMKAVLSLKNAFIGLGVVVGVGGLTKSFINAAATSENYRVRLNTLLGSVEKGNKLFTDMAAYASTVSYSYSEIMGSATQLSGVMTGGVEEIKKWMPMIADLAAVSGVTIQEATGQVIKMYSAGAASADLFRERGILAMMGFKAGVHFTAEETKRMMFDAWNATDSKFKGITKKLAKTWGGLLSMVGDSWFQIQNVIMGAGIFDALKEGLDSFNEGLKTWINNNQDLLKQEIPKYVESIKTELKWVTSELKGIAKLVGEIWKYSGMKFIWDFSGWADKEIKKVFADFQKMREQLAELKAAPGGVVTKPIELRFAMPDKPKDIIPMTGITAPELTLDALGFGAIEDGIVLFETYTDKLNYMAEATLNAKDVFAAQWPVSPGEEYIGQFIDYKEQNEEKLEVLNTFLHREKQAKLNQFDYNKFLLNEENILNKKKYADDAKMLEQWVKTYDAEMGKLKETTTTTFSEDMANAITGWGSHFSSTLNDMLWDANATFGDILESFAKMITQMMMQKAVVDPILGSFTGWLASAKGNVFSGGDLVPFASGGVVTKPTIFPMANGMGLMGEAGPEAVMPLARTSGGDLGVKALSSGVTVNVINNTQSEVNVEQGKSGNGRQLIQIVVDEVADNISRGGNVGRIINSTFGLNRAGAVR